MGQTIGPVVASPGIKIDPEEWSTKPPQELLTAINWRQEEILKITHRLAAKEVGYKEALLKQRYQREVTVLRNLLPKLRVVSLIV